MPLDAMTKQSKGMAYVTFAKSADALSAYEKLDRTSFQGRLIHILGAVDRKGNEAGGRKKTVKEEKLAKWKANAEKDFNWSMLYMNVRPCQLLSYDENSPIPRFRATLSHRQLRTAWTLTNPPF